VKREYLYLQDIPVAVIVRFITDMKKTLSTLMLATLARLLCLLGLTFAAAATMPRRSQ